MTYSVSLSLKLRKQEVEQGQARLGGQWTDKSRLFTDWDKKSRMNREVHVRSCGGIRVKVPFPTRLPKKESLRPIFDQGVVFRLLL